MNKVEVAASARALPSHNAMPLTASSLLVCSDDQVSTTVGAETVMLGMHDGVYYGLDAVGALAWALLATPRRVSELVYAVVSDFDVTPAQCEHDLLALLEELLQRGLICEVETQDRGA